MKKEWGRFRTGVFCALEGSPDSKRVFLRSAWKELRIPFHSPSRWFSSFHGGRQSSWDRRNFCFLCYIPLDVSCS